MICLDTTFLIDLWRKKAPTNEVVCGILRRYSGETFAVPTPAVGEFLEGAASISEERFREAVVFLRLFQHGAMTFETAEWYARIVADLRRRDVLAGRSKADLWIAAWAIEHGATLATRNARDFDAISGLQLLAY
jgi:tRNA(fMet)-specific endonuclease VapC